MYPRLCCLFFCIRAACILCVACAAFACVKQPPKPNTHAQTQPPPLPSLQHWEEEAMRFVQTQNALLWQHWTSDKPLALESGYATFEALFSEQTWREMQSLPEPASHAQACALKNLRAFVLGELLAQKLQHQNHQVALLENKLTVMYRAKDFPWHELGRLLAHEKEAVHRKNLWLYSLKKALSLDAAIQAREQQMAQALQHLNVDEARATQWFREADFGELSLKIQARLNETQAHWCAQVETLAAQQTHLKKASRADLPFFFQTQLSLPPSLAEKQEALAEAVFEKLGLWPAPRFERHIGETQALPLALNGGFGTSQLAFTPTQSPHSLQQLLGEMGRALSWTYVAENQWACRHLGPPILSNATALLFAQLAQNKAWWVEQTLPSSTAENWERAFRAQGEFAFRKTAANFLSQLAGHSLSHEEASKAYLAIQSEVLCTESLEAETARLRIDSAEFFATADMLRAHLLAEQMWKYLSKRFGKTWWNVSAAGEWLATLWREGNALPAEFLFERASPPAPPSLIAASSTPPSSR